MSTDASAHRWGKRKKSFSFPLIILKTHIRHRRIPAVPCSEGGEVFESFLFEFHVVFAARRLRKWGERSIHTCTPLHRLEWISNPVKKLKIENELEDEGMNLRFRGVNGCIWISLHLLLRSFLRLPPCMSAKLLPRCGSERKTMFHFFVSLRSTLICD